MRRLWLLGVAGTLAPASAAAQGLVLPRGFSVANQLEYAWSRETEEPILESWTDVRVVSGALSAGVRFVAFQPPDPTVSTSRSHFDMNYRFIEASSDNGSLRAGHTYAIFGQGLALNAYEERDVRVDANLEGIDVRGRSGDLSFQLVTGTTVFGSSEDLDRARGDRLHGADVSLDTGVLGATLGGSAVRLQRDGAPPQNLSGMRVTAAGGPLYVHAEYASITRPGPTGRGLYLSATLGAGPVDVTGEYKDYEAMALRNSGGIPYNLPPALVREHTYTLLNRHPHALDPDDEKGFQVEGTLTHGFQQLLGHYSQTRNHDDDDEFNTFDEIYGELHLELGAFAGLEEITLVNALDYQKSFATGLTPDPFRMLHTNVHELRVILDETYSGRLQFEHQHNESQIDGEYDSWFGLLECSRSPDLTVNLVAETSNRSSAQREPGEAIDGAYGVVTYHVSAHHDVSVLYGRRLAGFVCVGGVCRLEPEFDGVEVRLLSRF